MLTHSYISPSVALASLQRVHSGGRTLLLLTSVPSRPLCWCVHSFSINRHAPLPLPPAALPMHAYTHTLKCSHPPRRYCHHCSHLFIPSVLPFLDAPIPSPLTTTSHTPPSPSPGVPPIYSCTPPLRLWPPQSNYSANSFAVCLQVGIFRSHVRHGERRRCCGT